MIEEEEEEEEEEEDDDDDDDDEGRRVYDFPFSLFGVSPCLAFTPRGSIH